ncbi:MAG: RNA-protein complex protein Nop10 [Candidatus Parvarchaeota archaeon]|nr:RNA-protein complex protein Nop10 [Candidatus Parvarchaeota archaeon]
MKRIRYCQRCDRYTLKNTCSVCGKETIINTPQKYSRDEEIAKYRRKIKRSAILDGLNERI